MHHINEKILINKSKWEPLLVQLRLVLFLFQTDLPVFSNIALLLRSHVNYSSSEMKYSATEPTAAFVFWKKQRDVRSASMHMTTLFKLITKQGTS